MNGELVHLNSEGAQKSSPRRHNSSNDTTSVCLKPQTMLDEPKTGEDSSESEEEDPEVFNMLLDSKASINIYSY